MVSQRTFARCLAIVEECCAAGQWGLSSALQQHYAATISSQLLDEASSLEEIRTVVRHYHADHQRVLALRDAGQIEHQQEWARWMSQARAVLRREGLGWSSDSAVEDDDLAQIASAELARALPGYRYRSRFSVWAYRVIVQAIQRHLRDSLRARRAGRPASLDALPEVDAPADPAHDIESGVGARLLYRDVMAILSKQADQRLSYLFHLAAIEDRRVAEIGELVRLHPSRVRALLQQIRSLLREHPAIQAWQSPDGALEL